MNDDISTAVLSVCIAYEAGFGQGVCGRNVENPYSKGSRDSFVSWAYGYQQGAQRLKQDKTAGSPSLISRLTSGADACRASVANHADSPLEADKAVTIMFRALDEILSEAAREIERLNRCACGLSTPHAYQIGRCTPGWTI